MDFAYVFDFSFFSETLMNGCSAILMAPLLTKHSIVPAFKKTGVGLQSKFVERKRSLSFEVSRYLFARNKV